MRAARQLLFSLRSPPGQLGLLALAVFAELYVREGLGPLVETMRSALHLSDAELAMLSKTAITVPTALVLVPLGIMADRFSRRRLLQACLVMMTLASILLALALTFDALLAIRLLLGVVSTGPVLLAVSMIGDLFPAAQRGRALAVIEIAAIAGHSATFAIGGALVQINGADRPGYSATLFMMGLVLVPILATSFALREPARLGPPTDRQDLMTGIRLLWGYRRSILPLLVGRVLVSAASVAALAWMAPFMQRHLGASPGHAGTIIATILLATGLVSAPLAGLAADISQRVGGPRATMVALSGCALSMALLSSFGVLRNEVAVVILFAGFVLMVHAVAVIGLAASIIIVPAEVRGTYVSLSMAAGNLVAGGLAALIVSGVSQALGGPNTIGTAMTLVAGVASAAAAIMFAATGRSLIAQDSRPRASLEVRQ